VPVVASPTPVGVEELDAVRALQHALYRAAKADPGRRFHALYDKVSRRDVLQRAWEQVRRNRGAPGIDQLTTQQVEQYGVDRLLDQLAVVLEDGSYRPLAARRVLIPKPGSTEQRPLSIPTVTDRVVQAALKIVLEPVFEADMSDCSFGFRPRRAAHDGLQVVVDEAWKGRRWVVETDIADCFSAIPHSGLMSAVKERICDRKVLALLGAFLRAGVMQEGSVRRPVTGTPQGGVISPVLATSICTGWTGRGAAPTGRWSGMPMLCWCSGGPVGRPRPRWRGFGAAGRPRVAAQGGQDANRAPD
jgi:retron-type reverse transcriptase